MAANTQDALTNQLYLATREVDPVERELVLNAASSSGRLNSKKSRTYVPYATLIDRITEVVDTAEITQISTATGTRAMKAAGHMIIDNLKYFSPNLSGTGKLDLLENASIDLEVLRETSSTPREVRALDYLLRVFNMQKTIFEKSISVMKNILKTTQGK
jgi:hypothetical protein